MHGTRIVSVLALVLGFALAAVPGCGGGGGTTDELCANGADDDGDGLTDCLDLEDCGINPVCAPLPAEVDCDDRRDDDADGRTDCADPDCAADPACTTPLERNCADGVDDDADGETDCADLDCARIPPCGGSSEVDCTNGVDDDRDGNTDCADADCASDPGCAGTHETQCANLLDDDADGATDCDDLDCASDPGCAGTHETQCANLLDDDADGATDCADEDCIADPACVADREANCANLVDDDGDGFTDCLDDDCDADPACGPPAETDCTNGADDDGDGFIDCADRDCVDDPACTGRTETSCTNRVDDDGDGALDCADDDCLTDPACTATCTDDALEDNDTLGTATDESAVGPATVLVSVYDDDDFFAIDVCRGAVVALDILFTHADGDIDTYLESDTATELARSAGGRDNEHIAWTGDRLGTVYLRVTMFDPDRCNDYTLDVAVDRSACVTTESDCGDMVDDDGDGAIDCADVDCAGDPSCVPETDCTNGVDDDLDGLTDCADPGCAADPACAVTGGESCTAPFVLPDDPTGAWRGDLAGMANDHRAACGGGSSPEVVFEFTLTARAVLFGSTAGSGFNTVLYLRSGECTPGTEVACNDDGAGIAPASSFLETLEPGTYWVFVNGYRGASGAYVLTLELREPEACDDGTDNDGDGAIDCADDDCAADPACFEALCDDGTDNDGDGATDCADADCAGTAACFESACGDDIDNDGDGAIDCADADCTYDAACLPACAEDAHENNDSRSTATEVTTIAATEWLAALNGDDDYFSIAVCDGAVVTIDALFRHALGDVNIYLQDGTGTVVAASQGAVDDEHIDWTADALGTMYLRVHLYGRDACNVYKLVVGVERSACP